MRELAVQASNDTNDANDRANLQLEIDQLTTEIDRISSTTSWAGQSLIDGTGSFSFQVGSQTTSADSISTALNSMSSTGLGIGLGDTTTALAAGNGTSASGSTIDVQNNVTAATVSHGGQTFSTGIQSISLSGGGTLTLDGDTIKVNFNGLSSDFTSTLTVNGTAYTQAVDSSSAAKLADGATALLNQVKDAYTWSTAAATDTGTDIATLQIYSNRLDSTVSNLGAVLTSAI
jgi:flagellin